MGVINARFSHAVAMLHGAWFPLCAFHDSVVFFSRLHLLLVLTPSPFPLLSQCCQLATAQSRTCTRKGLSRCRYEGQFFVVVPAQRCLAIYAYHDDVLREWRDESRLAMRCLLSAFTSAKCAVRTAGPSPIEIQRETRTWTCAAFALPEVRPYVVYWQGA